MFGFGIRARVRRAGKDAYELRLPDEERAVLRSLPGQLRELIEADDPSLVRLFPPAYLDDDERDAEYRRLVRDDLVERHLEAMAIVEATVDKKRVTEEELLGWLRALNDVRLVLGTRLDVSEDMDEPPPDDPNAGAYALYYYLGWLQEQVVAALDPEY